MGRRILNRKDLRADYDAAERRQGDEEEVDDEAEGDEDDEEEAESDEEEAGDEEAGEEEEVEVVAPKKKPAKKKAPAAAKPKSRARTAKNVRMRVVWGVFNNSHQCVATYEYPRRKDADDHAAKLTADKKSTHFVQPVKEAIEQKETKEKA